jgi:hypothetical protein
MGAVAKFFHVMALLAKAESTYGTGVALSAATDAIKMFNKDRKGAPLRYAYLYDGANGPTIGALGQRKRIAPSGLSLRGPLPFQFKGPGVAYSASVVSSLHTLLKAAGYTATLDSTAAAEKYTYAPTASDQMGTSLSAELYARGQKASAVGVIGSIKCDAPDLSPPTWMFDFNGIGTLPD